MDYLELLSSYKSVLIIGTYPPPLGGVSVHIYRLHKILPNSSVFDLSKKQSFPFENALKLFFQLLFHKYDAIHVHSFRAKYLLII